METLFSCKGLTKILDGFTLKDISFDVEAGSVLGVVGRNGSGKTTMLRCLLGSYRTDQNEGEGGDIMLDGKHYIRDVKDYRKDIAYVMQSVPFATTMKAAQVGEMYGYFYRGFDQDKYKELLKKYEIPKDQTIAVFSEGQKMRMQIAFAQSYEAKLYIMDEPVGNLDVEFRDSVYDMIRELTAGEEKAVILSSHLVTELERIADKLLWIRKTDNVSKVSYLGDMDDLKEQYRLLSTGLDKEGLIKAGISGEKIAGYRLRSSHNEYLLWDSKGKIENSLPAELVKDVRYADLNEIMYYVEKEEDDE